MSSYDKVIACVVLVAMLLSLSYLAVKVGTIRKELHDFDTHIANLKVKFPDAETVDTKPFQDALSGVEKPFALEFEMWTNSMVFVPEARVWCIDCKRPIPYDAMQCPVCGSDQPLPRDRDEDYDGDGDGIPNLSENRLGLNPFDPSDANEDLDGDGFSNLVEFRANPQTDMRNPKSYPPPEDLLWVVAIRANPFGLRFKSIMTLPDGSQKFGVNTRVRGRVRTYFVKLGEEVEGFTVESYEQNIVKREGSALGQDESVLTLKRGKQDVRLIKGKDIMYNEYVGLVQFDLDNSRQVVKPDEQLSIKVYDEKKDYTVISIDPRLGTIVIIRNSDQEKFLIRKRPGAVEQEGF